MDGWEEREAKLILKARLTPIQYAQQAKAKARDLSRSRRRVYVLAPPPVDPKYERPRFTYRIRGNMPVTVLRTINGEISLPFVSIQHKGA